jgi:hypothetical protein
VVQTRLSAERSGERLSILFDAFNALSNANKAAREKLKE